jgi:hypothetical protein
MWAILAVLAASGASILATVEIMGMKQRGKKRRARVVFQGVAGTHSVQAWFSPNHKER